VLLEWQFQISLIVKRISRRRGPASAIAIPDSEQLDQPRRSRKEERKLMLLYSVKQGILDQHDLQFTNFSEWIEEGAGRSFP